MSAALDRAQSRGPVEPPGEGGRAPYRPGTPLPSVWSLEPNPTVPNLPIVRGLGPKGARPPSLLQIALIVGIIAGLTIAGLALLDVPFHLRLRAANCRSLGTAVSFPAESSVTFQWHASGAQAIELNVSFFDQLTIYSSNGTSGAGSFSSFGGPYFFNATACSPTNVSVTGSYLIGGGFI